MAPDRWDHRALRRFAIVAVTLGLLTAPLACTTALVPPPPQCVKDPVAVHVLDHGRTPSLIVPDDHGGMIRYAYGDWNWYALEKQSLLDGLAALFLPTQGALGRKKLPGPATAANVDEHVGLLIEELHTFQVEREAANRLRESLDQICEQNQQTLVVNESAELEFVHHPRAYWALGNSNHVLAGWLREMGVRVRGLPMVSQWTVRTRIPAE